MTTIPENTQRALDALREAVTQELDKKRRLGHYAVIWQDGKPVAIGEDAPANDSDEHEP
ncbi:MAG: hypothetical protein WBB01_23040 [Phormidesmis sp.]